MPEEIIQIDCPPELLFLQPYAISKLVRIGNPRDGGYATTLDAIERSTILISLGLGENWSFESAASEANPNLKIYTFDHTVSSTFFLIKTLKGFIKLVLFKDTCSNFKTRLNRLLNYLKFWQFSSNNKHSQIKMKEETFVEVITKIDPSNLVVLKIDIEGSEWELLDLINEHNLLFSTILIEVHDFDRHQKEFQDFLHKMSSKFALVHLHANNFEGVGTNNFPKVFEVSLIRRDLAGALGQKRPMLPIPGLDFPNATRRPDFEIYF